MTGDTVGELDWADVDGLMRLFRSSSERRSLSRHLAHCPLHRDGEPHLPHLPPDAHPRLAQDRHWFTIPFSLLPPALQHRDAVACTAPLAALRCHLAVLTLLTDTLKLDGNEQFLPDTQDCALSYISSYDVASVRLPEDTADLLEGWLRSWTCLPFEAQVRRLEEAAPFAEAFVMRYSVHGRPLPGDLQSFSIAAVPQQPPPPLPAAAAAATPASLDGLFAQQDHQLGRVAAYIDAVTRCTAHWAPMHALSRYAAAIALVGELAVDAATTALDRASTLGIADDDTAGQGTAAAAAAAARQTRGRGGGAGAGGRPTPVELPAAVLAVAVARAGHGRLVETAAPGSLVSLGLDEALRLAQDQASVPAAIAVEGVRAMLEVHAVVDSDEDSADGRWPSAAHAAASLRAALPLVTAPTMPPAEAAGLFLGAAEAMVVAAATDADVNEAVRTVDRATEAATFFLPVVPTHATDVQSIIHLATQAIHRDREVSGRAAAGGAAFVSSLALGRPATPAFVVAATARRSAAVRSAALDIGGNPTAAATYRHLAGPEAAADADRLVAASGRAAKAALAAALTSVMSGDATAAPAARRVARDAERVLHDVPSRTTAAAVHARALLALGDVVGASRAVDAAYTTIPRADTSCALAEAAATVAASRADQSGDPSHLLRAARFARLPPSPSPTCWHLRALSLHAYVATREAAAGAPLAASARRRLLALRDAAATSALRVAS